MIKKFCLTLSYLEKKNMSFENFPCLQISVLNLPQNIDSEVIGIFKRINWNFKPIFLCLHTVQLKYEIS